MSIKGIIQITLVILIFVISYVVFISYFKKTEDFSEIENTNETTAYLREKIDSKEIIEKLEYKSEDTQGNEYIITSEFAKTDDMNEDILYLENVKAEINLIGKETVYIFSQFAKYNKSNYDTNFYESVNVLYDDNSIKGKNLDLFFKDNIASMYDDVLFNNNESILQVDKINWDLSTGNISLNMKNKTEKIKISKK